VNQKLYFNGVNGTTGSYGLSPMSVTALTNHILHNRVKLLQRLYSIEQELNNKITNDDKIVTIVDLLMRMVISLTNKNMPEDILLEGLAAKLMSILLEKNDVHPGDIKELATILKQQPTQTIAFIIQQLGKGQQGSRDLTRLLMSEEGDLSLMMRHLLRQQFGYTLDRIQVENLDLSADKALAGDGTLRQVWMDNFIRQLNQLPMATMRIITDRDTVLLAMQQLSRILKQQRENLCDQPYYIDAFTQQLDENIGERGQKYWPQVTLMFYRYLKEWKKNYVKLHWLTFSSVLREWLSGVSSTLAGDMGVISKIDPRDLSKTGWAIIFPALMPATQVEGIKQVMEPLLTLREKQAGKLFRIYEGKDGYRPGDKAGSFLMRPPLRNARPEDPVDPENTGVPYYLLIVGSPELIPFKFQYQLDVQYAVGRLDFGDDIQAYANYAHNVVAAERGPTPPKPKALFAGVDNANDTATELSHKHLVTPLHAYFNDNVTSTDWAVHKLEPEQITKTGLLTAIQDIHPPTLLFTASHGVEFDENHASQQTLQGALLCQNWQGDAHTIPSEYYISAGDMTSKVNLTGTIAFLFACYSAGTPQFDSYYRMAFKEQGKTIAKVPFIAALPKQMLRLQKKGALAIVGHVERVWGTSFLAAGQTPPPGVNAQPISQTAVFENVLYQLLHGHPIGSAMDCFNMRYAALSTELTNLYHEIGDLPTTKQAYELAERWTANNDARGYIILGDPAVRLSSKPIDDTRFHG
jgi:hypothetical protein